MKGAPYPWVRNEYPLVDRRITRAECISTMAADPEVPAPPRSACWHCPFHSAAEWRDMKLNDPVAFGKAVALDEALRKPGAMPSGQLKGAAYLHASLTPLAEVDLRNEEDRGQMNMFDMECEGMCGL